MLTRLIVRNFKRFRNVEIELGNPVVFIGPNDSGKTTALQALALWETGLRRWNEKRKGKTTPEKRPGVTINRRDLVSVPAPNANLLWRDLHVRDIRRVAGKPETQNVRVDIIVEGVIEGRTWSCGLEFDYANEESIYCRPLRLSEENNPERMRVPTDATGVKVAFLPPMSGLAASETRLDPGAISVRLGEGRTAEVLRNLCYRVLTAHTVRTQFAFSTGDRITTARLNNLTFDADPSRWTGLCRRMQILFGVQLDEPVYVPERGEITMTYRDARGVRLDLSSAGRGFQQTLLLLAHLSVNPGSVLLLDEPDAHLEILRQRQIYQVLTEAAKDQDSQIVMASHSEVVLNEAGDRDVVVAFLGKPHRIDDRGSQLLKSLKEIGFEQYYQAEQTGWVLYLEGSTDLAVLRALADKLGHPAFFILERPFVRYVQNQPQKARDHFHGLREAKPDLQGYALFDHLDRPLQDSPPLKEHMWQRREIENYLTSKEVLLFWAKEAGEKQQGGPLLSGHWAEVMDESIAEIEKAMETLDKGSPWAATTKTSDEFLDPLFGTFYRKLGLPNLMSKSDYHVLARYVPREQIDPEVRQVLDEIAEVAARAHPSAEDENA